VPNVDYVVHYSIPSHLDVFVHRSGRTARAGKQGLVLSLVSGAENKSYSRLERDLEVSALPLPIDEALISRVKTRVKLAAKVQRLESKDRNEQMDKQWFLKAAADMDIALDDDEEGGALETLNKTLKRSETETKKQRSMNELRQLKDELRANLQQDLLPRGRSKMFVAGGAAPELLEAVRSGSRAPKKRSALQDLEKTRSEGKKKIKQGR